MLQKVVCVKCGKEFDAKDKAGQNKHVYIDHKRAGHPFPVKLFFKPKKA